MQILNSFIQNSAWRLKIYFAAIIALLSPDCAICIATKAADTKPDKEAINAATLKDTIASFQKKFWNDAVFVSMLMLLTAFLFGFEITTKLLFNILTATIVVFSLSYDVKFGLHTFEGSKYSGQVACAFKEILLIISSILILSLE